MSRTRVRSSVPRPARTFVVFTLAVLGSAVVASCAASPRERYEIMSFLFDGVPDPDAVTDEMAMTEDGRPRRAVPRPSLHQPVVDARCPVCHGEGTGGEGRRSFRGGSWQAIQRAWDKCGTCHSDPDEVRPESIVISDEGHVHGPVAVGNCRPCHNGHQSRFPHLMRTERADTVCVTCHEDLTVREGAMAAMDCIVCHDPHRAPSAADMFLRGGRAGACTGCHEIDVVARPWVHGPVAAGECEVCHDAHGSAGSVAHVQRPLAAACVKCHEADRLPVDAGCSAAVECDTCHVPHAAQSASDLFLRDRIPVDLPVFVPPGAAEAESAGDQADAAAPTDTAPDTGAPRGAGR